MSVIRTLAVHEVVRAVFPRTPVEGEEVGLAAGKAVDSALSRYSHEHAQGRRPSSSGIAEYAGQVFDEEIAAVGAEISAADRERALAPIPEVLRAFRRSGLFGLPRPRSRMILINSTVGVYAQPDFWDARSRIFELKSYLASPKKPEIALQLRLFQLAFPGFREELVCLDRHATPVRVSLAVIDPPSPSETEEALRQALELGQRAGRERVFEYLEVEIVRYALAEPARGSGATDHPPAPS